jgi:hypothetical protein
MELKPGMRLQSQADATQVVVVKAPARPVDLRCGGHPMVPLGTEASESVATGFDGGTQIGKRYADDALPIEVLCTKAGAGSLTIGSEPLAIKGAKPLPSSD